MGYLVAPPDILEAVASAKHLSDWHASLMTQRSLAKFMADGYLLKHVRRCHGAYVERRERLLRRFQGELSPWFEPVPFTAGIHMAVRCKRPIELNALLTLARRVDVGLYTLDAFFHSQPVQPGLMLGFGAIEADDIDAALDRVRDILLELT